MTSILKQENGELFIYRSEKEFPKALVFGDTIELVCEQLKWFSSSERIKVAEGEKEKFLSMLHAQHNNINLHFIHERIENGTQEIPESCYEVRYEDKSGCFNKLAYFKDDRASEKETDVCPECGEPLWLIDRGNVVCANGSCTNLDSYPIKQSARPHENTSLDPKEHAIQFHIWVCEAMNDEELRESLMGLEVNDIYDIFLSRK